MIYPVNKDNFFQNNNNVVKKGNPKSRTLLEH